MNDFNEREPNGFEDLDDAYATITMCDDEGNDIEFIVVSSVESGGVNYLLVIESGLENEEEAEAVILKEVRETGDESFFAVVDDDAEFEKAAALFQNSSDDYEIEI